MESQNRILVFLAEFDFQIEQIRSIYKILEKKVSLIQKQPVPQEIFLVLVYLAACRGVARRAKTEAN